MFNSGTRRSSTSNLLISIWMEHSNVAVVSSTDENFVRQLSEWAEQNGYRVTGIDREES